MKSVTIVVFIYLFFNLSCWSSSYGLNDLYKKALEGNPQNKIFESELKEIEYGLMKLNAEYYPKLDAIVGGEKRHAINDSSIDTNRFVAELRLKYNLFKFGQSKDEIDILKKIKMKKEREYSWWKENIKRNLKGSYYAALSINKKIHFLKGELGFNKELISKVKLKIKSGLIGKSDLLDIDLRRNELNGQMMVLEEKLDHHLDEIRKDAFLEHDAYVNFSGDFPHDHYSLELEKILDKVKNQNVELRALILDSEGQELKVEQMAKKRWPEVNLMGRYGRMRIDEQYSNLSNNEGLIGIYVEIPLFDGGKRDNTRKIYHERYQQKKLESEKLKKDLTIEATHKYELLLNIHNQLDLLEDSLKRGKVYFDQVLDEYKRGIKNSLDLVSARDRIVNQNLNWIELKYKYIASILEIEKLMGTDIKEIK